MIERRMIIQDTPLEKLRENLKRLICIKFKNLYVLFDPETVSWIPISDDDIAMLREFYRSGSLRERKGFHLIGRMISSLIGVSYRIVYNKLLPYPSVYYFEITKGCNLRCVYCYIGSSPELLSYKGKMKVENWLELIDQINTLGGREVIFTGGEPLLKYDDILSIGKYAKEHGLTTSLITNGVLLNTKRVEELSRIIDNITVSLDSHIGSVNAVTRGYRETHRVIYCIKSLLKKGVNISVNCVVTRNNINSLTSFLDHLQKIGVSPDKIKFILMAPAGRALTLDHFSVNPMDLVKKTFLYNLRMGVIPNHSRTAFNKFSRKYMCGASVFELYIDCDGNVYPCRMLVTKSGYLGNVLKKSLKDILNSSNRYNFVDSISKPNLKVCKNCIYRNVCAGGCRGNVIGSLGNLTDPDPINCIIVKNTFPLYMIVESYGLDVLRNLNDRNVFRQVEVVSSWLEGDLDLKRM